MKSTSHIAKAVHYALLVLITLYISGCKKKDTTSTSSPSDPSVPSLRLAYRPRALTDVSPVILAEKAVSSEKVKVQLVPVATAQEGFARMHAGEVDGFAGAP